jgi:hypothetical protein
MKVQDDVTILGRAIIDNLLHRGAVADGKIEPTVLVQGKADDIAFPSVDSLFRRSGDPAIRVAVIDRKLEPIDVHPMQVNLASGGFFDFITSYFELRWGGLGRLE